VHRCPKEERVQLVGIRTGSSTVVSAAIVTADGRYDELVDLETFWTDPDHWFRRAAADGTRTVHEASDVTLVPPVLPGAKVICVGLNYRAHHAEGSLKDEQLPEFPTLFARWTSSLTVGGVPVPVPRDEAGLDWEGEIAAFVGRRLVDADAATARSAICGYATFNDITSRRAQKLTSQWILGKNGDHSGPLGPIVPAAEVGDLRDGLRVQTRVNGSVVQDGNTRDMIYEVGEVLALVSRTITLVPGDLICTGTPEGVGYARTPPWLLGDGDVVEVEVERIGTLSTPVVGNAFRHAAEGSVSEATA
jgi:2-keto-4-pentenoate hydratase/2-oxohepta-3-ene-1,7-dioic acid hydratase in catechol pathway